MSLVERTGTSELMSCAFTVALLQPFDPVKEARRRNHWHPEAEVRSHLPDSPLEWLG